MGDDNKIYITNSSDLPEVTITAPRKYFVGYDENVNPVYTTDRTQSQDYLQSQIPVGNAEQKRRQWAFENVGANEQTKPGIQGDAKDISRLVTAGIGSTLAPIAVAPVARAVFPAVKTLVSAGHTKWNAVKPEETIHNWLYRQTFTPQGTLTKGATELLGSTVSGEGLNEILNQKSKSGDWTEDVDHRYFHGDIGNTIGEEGRSMFLTAPLYGTYNAGKQMINKIRNNTSQFIFGYVPYYLDKISSYTTPVLEGLVKAINDTPNRGLKNFKNGYNNARYQQLRYRASNRPIKNLPDIQLSSDIAPNSQLDNVDLLRQRLKTSPHSDSGFILTDNGPISSLQYQFESTPIYKHIPIKDVWNFNKKSNIPWYAKLIATPIEYLIYNTRSAAYFPETTHIMMNPTQIKLRGFDNKLRTVESHELAHRLQNNIADLTMPTQDIYTTAGLPQKIQKYLNPTELSARGTQIKNYFGLTDQQPISPDMLRYAAKNYVKDTGMNNNMNQFFRGIKDYGKFADWINKYSFKQGGKINNK